MNFALRPRAADTLMILFRSLLIISFSRLEVDQSFIFERYGKNSPGSVWKIASRTLFLFTNIFFSLHNLMKHHFRSRFFGSLDRYLHFSIIYNIMLLYEFVEILFYIKFEYIFLYDSFWRERNSGVWRFITIKDRIVLIF